MVGESAEAVAAGLGSGSSSNKMPTLEEYGTNLTKLAEEVVMIFKCFCEIYDYSSKIFSCFSVLP